MIDRTIFVTGMQRSGTTLLEKLLGAQKSISMLSQPFPWLFTEAKGVFLDDDERYPLGHLFLESRYDHESFAMFLRSWRTTPDELERLFTRMETFSGQYTRFDAAQRREAFSKISATDDFAQVMSSLDRWLAPKAADWFGSKETLCEEYVPPLLDRGFRCAIILRDPRDVVASLNHGQGKKFGGEVKPILFNIRNWRKSVAVALAMEGHPRFHCCRYEDLVSNPAAELERLAERFGLTGVEMSHDIRDEAGDVWRGNSSYGEHDGVGITSVARYREVLRPTEVAEFIEATCVAELRRLGYPTSITRTEAIEVIERFREPDTSIRGGLERDVISLQNTRLEVQRLERVTQPPDHESRRWFVRSRAHAKLREGFEHS